MSIKRYHPKETFGSRIERGNVPITGTIINSSDASRLNEIVDRLNWALGIRGSGSVQVSIASSGPKLLKLDEEKRTWQITGGGTGGVYSAREVTKVAGQYFIPLSSATITNLVEVNGLSTLPTGTIAEGYRSKTSTEWLFCEVRHSGSCSGTLNFSVLGCPDYTYVSPPGPAITSCPNGPSTGLVIGATYSLANSVGTVVCSGTTTSTLNSFGTQVSCATLPAGNYTLTLTASRYTTLVTTFAVGCYIQKTGFALTPATGYLCCMGPESSPSPLCQSPIAQTLHLTDPDGVAVTMYGGYVDNVNYSGSTPESGTTGCGTVWYGCKTKSMGGMAPQYGVCTSATVTVAIQYVLYCSYAAGWTLYENWTICCEGDPCSGSFNPCLYPGPGTCGSNGQIGSGTIAPGFGPPATAAYSPASCLPLSLSFALPCCNANPTTPMYGYIVCGTATVTE